MVRIGSGGIRTVFWFNGAVSTLAVSSRGSGFSIRRAPYRPFRRRTSGPPRSYGPGAGGIYRLSCEEPRPIVCRNDPLVSQLSVQQEISDLNGSSPRRER